TSRRRKELLLRADALRPFMAGVVYPSADGNRLRRWGWSHRTVKRFNPDNATPGTSEPWRGSSVTATAEEFEQIAFSPLQWWHEPDNLDGVRCRGDEWCRDRRRLLPEASQRRA